MNEIENQPRFKKGNLNLILTCDMIPCSHSRLNATDTVEAKYQWMPPLKKYLTQWKERMFIILWILRTKLIPIKLQLDNLLQAKQLRFCFETMKCFSQSVSQWSTNQLQFCSERMKFFSHSVSQSVNEQLIRHWQVGQSVSQSMKS